MATITELGRIPPHMCFRTPRLFFSIYYKVPDNAFKLSAEHWRKSLAIREHITARDIFIEKEVTTEAEFKQAWSFISETEKRTKSQTYIGNILSHASKQDDSRDGLEFMRGDNDDGTVMEAEISALPKLSWSNYGYLVLSGCNTGAINERGWAPASAFTRSQKVVTIGQVGYAYFSKKWDEYSEKTSADKEIYLWAYKRGRNGYMGDGSRMKGNIFRP